MNPPIKIRPAKAEDLNFILNSWLKRYRDAIRARFVTDGVYYAYQHEAITKILQQPGLKAVVACNPDDEDQIYGYLIAEDHHIVPDLRLLHWLYVKGPLRRFGIAKALLESVNDNSRKNVHYTHKTKLVEFLDKDNQWIYNPYYCWGLL